MTDLIPEFNGKNILITGGAGYIGSTLVPMLLDAGYEVTVFDLFSCGIMSLLPMAKNPKMHVIKGDIRDLSHLEDVMRDTNIIIHLAAIVGYPACDNNANRAFETNCLGTKNITSLLTSDQKLIYASTGSCYGPVSGICTEETEISPLTVYGRTKADAERLVINANGVTLRLSTVFGISSRLRLDLFVNDLTYKALTKNEMVLYEGSFCRSFLHVRDVARAFIFALQNYQLMKGQVFNVGDKTMNLTKSEIAKCIQQNVKGCVIKEEFIDSNKKNVGYEVSFEKIKSIGYTASISVEEGIHEMLKVFPYIDPEDILINRNI